MAHPLGRKLESHTKTLMEGGLCPESITPAQYRGRLGGGGCLFSFFSLRQRKWTYEASFSAPERSALPLATNGTQESKKKKLSKSFDDSNLICIFAPER